MPVLICITRLVFAYVQSVEMDHQLAVVALRQAQDAQAAWHEEHQRAIAGLEETHNAMREKLARAQTQCAGLTSKMADMFPSEHVHKIQKLLINLFQVPCAF